MAKIMARDPYAIYGGAPKTKTITLTEEQLDALKWLLVEESERMDDDGREGSFNRSPLAVIYAKVKQAESGGEG